MSASSSEPDAAETPTDAEPAPAPAPARARPEPLGRALAALLASVGCAGTLLVAVRWHSPENFFEFNSLSIPWRYTWSLGIVALVLFATTAYLARGLLAAVAWFAAALLVLSAVGLVEAFWFALQVLQGEGASRVLTYARGYAVSAAVALVLLWGATALRRRRG
jgi:hypothetical protein